MGHAVAAESVCWLLVEGVGAGSPASAVRSDLIDEVERAMINVEKW